MIHFLPDPDTICPAPEPVAEAVARFRSIQQALRLVEMTEGRPARAGGDDLTVEALWPFASEPVRRCFDQRSTRIANAAAAGIETLLECRSAGGEPNPVAIDLLAETIQAGLVDIERLFHGRA
ncbi:hypothetical protein HMF7854_05300 [Sphingomonas ginkgonis]|uniref:Uncharacterized protein n=1 Tax=Sphingomonas ginkgonis TaxID=2315330 RepID=A0A429V8P4_9SPHN|nr:hypothetical protein [Sphingomonas ginkgonis]RST30304.1 hypothetical protein HMF7854_05300 [Sphingomonas ginkgonis]